MKRLLSLFAGLILFTAALAAQPLRFTFAWLSDTHVGNATGADDLRKTVRDINALAEIDFVILSGDITEMGSDTELRLAKQILDSLNKPYFIIPGNHDVKWSESGTLSFARIWGADRFTFEKDGILFIGLHEGPRMRMADGHWAPEDLRWFDSLATPLQSSRKPLIFVTHYPIDPGIANWYEMSDRLKKLNTQAVLVGHGHRNRKDSYEGIPGVMGRSNLRGNRETGGFNIGRLRGDSLFFFERTTGDSTAVNPWHALALGTTDYASDTTKYARPDYSVNDQFPNVRAVWTYNAGYTVGNAPLVFNNRVYTGDASGVITALDLTNGALAWKFKTNGPIYSAPAGSENRIVVGSTDEYVYCLNAADGSLAWKVKTGAAVVASPAIRGGIVYIGGSDRRFRALSLRDGKLLWEFTGLNGFVESVPLLISEKNLVVFGAWDTYLYALEMKTGALRWKWTNSRSAILLSPAACNPVYANGAVFIAAPDRFMTAIDAETGVQLWRTGASGVRESIGISASGDRIFVRTMQDSICAFPASRTEPKPLWARNAGFGYDINSAALVEKNGTVFYGTKNGIILALDAASGEIRWEHRIGPGLVNTIAPLGMNEIVVSDFDGRVMLLRSGEK